MSQGPRQPLTGPSHAPRGLAQQGGQTYGPHSALMLRVLRQPTRAPGRGAHALLTPPTLLLSADLGPPPWGPCPSHPPQSEHQPPQLGPHPHPKIGGVCGARWVPDSRAFLDLSPRCSSEELLDRLFKKSVVTEAEVTAQSPVFPGHTQHTPSWKPSGVPPGLMGCGSSSVGLSKPFHAPPFPGGPLLSSPSHHLAGGALPPETPGASGFSQAHLLSGLEESSGFGLWEALHITCPAGSVPSSDLGASGAVGGGWTSSEPWPRFQVKVYIQQLAEGLHYLHGQSILHLDIKVLDLLGAPQGPGRDPEHGGGAGRGKSSTSRLSGDAE